MIFTGKLFKGTHAVSRRALGILNNHLKNLALNPPGRVDLIDGQADSIADCDAVGGAVTGQRNEDAPAESPMTLAYKGRLSMPSQRRGGPQRGARF